MLEPLISMLYPILGAHISGSEFQCPDLIWRGPCGIMANQVADSGGNKAQLSHLVEAICSGFAAVLQTQRLSFESQRHRFASLQNEAEPNSNDK